MTFIFYIYFLNKETDLKRSKTLSSLMNSCATYFVRKNCISVFILFEEIIRIFVQGCLQFSDYMGLLISFFDIYL